MWTPVQELVLKNDAQQKRLDRCLKPNRAASGRLSVHWRNGASSVRVEFNVTSIDVLPSIVGIDSPFDAGCE